MKVRVTSITWDGVGEMVRPVTVEMEKTLNLAFQDLFFGDAIAQLAIVVISVSSDENDRNGGVKVTTG